MKIPKDKKYHFIGCSILFIPFGLFLPLWLSAVIVFSIGIGIELGDFKHYGFSVIKSKDKVKIKEFLKNTFGDLVADGGGDCGCNGCVRAYGHRRV